MINCHFRNNAVSLERSDDYCVSRSIRSSFWQARGSLVLCSSSENGESVTLKWRGFQWRFHGARETMAGKSSDAGRVRQSSGIYLLRPGPLDQLRIHDLCPSLLALDVAPVREVIGYGVPSQDRAPLLCVAH